MSSFPQMSKRTLVISLASLTALVAMLLTGCGSSAASSGPVTLTVWSWVTKLQDEANLFEASHPNIKINVVNAGQGAAQYTKLQTALKAGSGAPDVVQIEYPYLPEFELTGKLVDSDEVWGQRCAKPVCALDLESGLLRG